MLQQKFFIVADRSLEHVYGRLTVISENSVEKIDRSWMSKSQPSTAIHSNNVF